MKKHFSLKAVILCVVVVVLSVTLFGCGEKGTSAVDEVEAIKRRGYVVAGVRTDVEGFSLLDEETDVYEGLEIDLAYQIAAEIFGVSAKEAKAKNLVWFTPITEDNGEFKLAEGCCDVMLACYKKSEKREKLFLLSESYFEMPLGVLANAEETFESLADLNDKKVGVIKNSSTEDEIVAYLTENKLTAAIDFVEFEISELAEWFEDADSLSDKKIDAFVADANFLETLKKDAEQVKICFTFAPNEYVAVVTLSSKKLLNYVNDAIKKAEKNGA